MQAASGAMFQNPYARHAPPPDSVAYSARAVAPRDPHAYTAVESRARVLVTERAKAARAGSTNHPPQVHVLLSERILWWIQLAIEHPWDSTLSVCLYFFVDGNCYALFA